LVMSNPIDEVKKTEEEAEDIKREALREANQIIKLAREKAEELAVEVEESTLEEKQRMITLAEEEGEKEVEGLSKVYKERSELLRKKAKQNMDEAVNFIRERIVR